MPESKIGPVRWRIGKALGVFYHHRETVVTRFCDTAPEWCC